MATLNLNTRAGTVDLIGNAYIHLERASSVDSILPIPVWDEEYASSPDTEGAKRIRSRPDNPTGAGRVIIQGTSVAHFRSNIVAWQAYVENVRMNGGSMTYTPTSGSAVTYDLVSMRITSMPQDAALLSQRVQESDFEFTAMPFGRLTAGTIVSGTASGPIDSISIPDPGGSAPALAQLILTDTATQDRGDVQFGVDEHWDSNLNYPTNLAGTVSLNTTGFDGIYTTRTGAWSTTDVVRGTLLADSKVLCKASSNHLGRHRVKGRFYGVGTGPIYAQFKWRIGEAAFTTNGWKQLPLISDFCELDMGMINVPAVTQGTQGWEGWVEAYTGGTITDTIDLAALEFLPADRYARMASQPIEPSTSVIANVTQAHDEFDQTAGTLTNKVLPGGGSWIYGGTAVPPTDFSVEVTGHTASRSAVSDTFPRLDYASANSVTDVVVKGDMKFSTRPAAAVRYGWLLRWVDGNNYAIVYQDPNQVLGDESVVLSPASLNFAKVIAGTLTRLKQAIGSQYANNGVYYSFESSIDKVGNYYVKWGIRGGGLTTVISGQDDVFKTAGALATGKVGIYDYSPSSTAGTRNYDNFVMQTSSTAVTTATSRVALSSGKRLIVDHQSALKEPSTGSVWTTVPKFEGSYLKIVPGQASRMVLKARRNNLDNATDSGITDTMTYAVVATPRVQLLG